MVVKKRALRFVGHRPEIQIYRLSCLSITLTIEWNPAVRRAKVFTIGDDRVMVGERDCRMLVAIGELKLGNHRIAFHIGPKAGG